jgi:hypothetical protein
LDRFGIADDDDRGNGNVELEEEELGRENIRDYIRKNDGRVHYIDD